MTEQKRQARLLVTLTDQEMSDVDSLIDRGIYRSRSDLGRMAIQKMIYRE